jgi:hypothetical protein
MPSLTPEAIKTRFNRAMPKRRRKFRDAFADFRSKSLRLLEGLYRMREGADEIAPLG